MIKINILSPGRFHVLDLARELNKNGYDVKFYSYVPTRRAIKFGLPAKCNVSFLWVLFPFLAVSKISNYSSFATSLTRWVSDTLYALFMRKCDVLISMSGEFTKCNKKIKRQGGVLIIERGSKHILEQKRILESIPSLKGTKPVPDINVKKELIDYELADFVSVASIHVKNSFLKLGYPERKIFVNPYGVDLSMFRPIPNMFKKFDVIMVGNWSYQKGCDLLEEAIKATGLKLLHVGSIGDIPFPEDSHFTHIEPVSQESLCSFYNQSHIFVMPSRQDGFGMVYTQAISCNLPIIGSIDSGTVDLKKIVDKPEYVHVVNPLTIDNLIETINKTLKQAKELGTSLYAGDGMDKLTWDSYGKRYSEFLESPVVKSILGGGKFDVIMVGIWCFRKGCDLIREVVEDNNLSMLHIGAIGDCALPQSERFVHVDPVPQHDLVFFYNLAKVFVLPSREEGMALVQAQAMACNLPLVGSEDSGAQDIQQMIEYPEYVVIVENYSATSVKNAINKALSLNESIGDKVYAGHAIENLTWAAYGARYADFIKHIM